MHVQKFAARCIGGVAVAVTLAVALSSSPATAAATNWPQFLQGGSDRVNSAETTLDASNVSSLTQQWSTTLSGGPFSPPIVVNGVVYVATYGGPGGAPGGVWALNAATGDIIWKKGFPDPITGGIAYASGTVFAATKAGELFALKAKNGRTKWQGSAGTQVFDNAAITYSQGDIYVSNEGTGGPGELSAWNAKGCHSKTCSPVWTASTQSGIDFTPTISGHTVYVGDDSGTVYAYNKITGAPLWSDNAGEGRIRGGGAVANGHLYVGTEDGLVLGFRVGCTSSCAPDYVAGTTAASIVGAPSAAGGEIYVTDLSGHLTAFPDSCTGTCSSDWTFSASGNTPGAPLYANGVVYFGAGNANAYAVDASDGSELWSAATPGAISSSLVVLNGVVYVPSTFGNTVLAYGLPAAV